MTRCPGCYTAQEARARVRQDIDAPVYLLGALLPFAIVAAVAALLHRVGRPEEGQR
jgi:hypothetical protein